MEPGCSRAAPRQRAGVLRGSVDQGGVLLWQSSVLWASCSAACAAVRPARPLHASLDRPLCGHPCWITPALRQVRALLCLICLLAGMVSHGRPTHRRPTGGARSCLSGLCSGTDEPSVGKARRSAPHGSASSAACARRAASLACRTITTAAPPSCGGRPASGAFGAPCPRGLEGASKQLGGLPAVSLSASLCAGSGDRRRTSGCDPGYLWRCWCPVEKNLLA
jgi:hypothetical protein